MSLETLQYLNKYLFEKKYIDILEIDSKNKMCHGEWRLKTSSSKDSMGLYNPSLYFS